jgi:hypothetical protein
MQIVTVLNENFRACLVITIDLYRSWLGYERALLTVVEKLCCAKNFLNNKDLQLPGGLY